MKDIIKRNFNKYVMILVLLALLFLFSSLSGNFMTKANFSNILITEVAAGFLALGGMFILITGEFDLSLGYNLCFCMVIGAYLAEHGVGLAGIVLAMILAGTVCGLINGLLAVHLKISSFIVTLAVGLSLSGIAQALSGGGVMYISKPQALINFTRGRIGNSGIGYCVILFLAVSILMYFIYNHTTFGRYLYAAGISNKIAFMAGIKTSLVRILAFTLAGFMAALGGIIELGQLGAASSAYGTSLLLPAYAVVFLSKTAFKPGYINVPGVLLSIVIVAVGSNGIQLIGAPTWGNYMFEGAILIFSMWLSTRFSVAKQNQ